MIRRPPRSTLFPTRRSSDLGLLGLLGMRRGRDRYVETTHAATGVAGAGYTGTAPGAGYGTTTPPPGSDRKSTRLNSSHANISYAVFCLKKKKKELTYNILT